MRQLARPLAILLVAQQILYSVPAAATVQFDDARHFDTAALLQLSGATSGVSVPSDLLAGQEVESNASEHRYIGWLDDESLVIREPENGSELGWIVVGGDDLDQTRFCDSSSDYVCFFSSRFTFAVPKQLAPGTSSWPLRGVRFELVKENLSVSLFGRTLDGLLLIRTPADANLGGEHSGGMGGEHSAGMGGEHSGGSPPTSSTPTQPVWWDSDELKVPSQSITYWMTGSTGFGASRVSDSR